MIRNPIFCALMLALLFCTVAVAGSGVELKDGRTFSGPLIHAGDKIGVATDEGLMMFDRVDVARVIEDPAAKATPEQRREYRQAMEQASRARVPEDAMKVWLAYLQERPEDDPMLQSARKQLGMWTSASKEGKVVWSGKLMTPAERDALAFAALEKLATAARLNEAGRSADALVQLRDAVSKWPEHPGIQFHLALAYQRERKPVDAVKYYRQVLEQHPNHVPSLNNLAAVECTRRQFLAGVPLMLRAVELAGDVVLVNDNAQRTLLRMEQLGLRGFEHERTKLHNATMRLEAAMNERGLTRWGTSWVTRERYEQYVAGNRRIQAQLEAMAGEVAALEQQVGALKMRIAALQHQRLVAPTEADLVRPAEYDQDGNLIRPRRIYPPSTITKEKIDLMLADYFAALALAEESVMERVAEGQRLKAGLVEPPQVMDYLLLTEAGDDIMLYRQERPQERPAAAPTPQDDDDGAEPARAKAAEQQSNSR